MFEMWGTRVPPALPALPALPARMIVADAGAKLH